MLATPGKIKAPLGNYLCKEKILRFVIDRYCVKNTVKNYPGLVYLFLLRMGNIIGVQTTEKKHD